MCHFHPPRIDISPHAKLICRYKMDIAIFATNQNTSCLQKQWQNSFFRARFFSWFHLVAFISRQYLSIKAAKSEELKVNIHR